MSSSIEYCKDDFESQDYTETSECSESEISESESS